jgi:hypothetical protein
MKIKMNLFFLMIFLSCSYNNIIRKDKLLIQNENNVKLYFIIPDSFEGVENKEVVNIISHLITHNLIKGKDFINAYKIKNKSLPKRINSIKDSIITKLNGSLSELSIDILKNKGDVVLILFASFDNMKLKKKLIFVVNINENFFSSTFDEFSIEGQFDRFNLNTSQLNRLIDKNSFIHIHTVTNTANGWF